MTRSIGLLVAVALALGGPATADDLVEAEKLESWTFDDVDGGEDLSGVAIRDDLMVVATDEGRTIQFLKQEHDGVWRLDESMDHEAKMKPGDGEADFEAVAWGEDHLYAIGSHSGKRNRVKNDHDPEDADSDAESDSETAAENSARIRTTAIEPNREWLYRIKVGDDSDEHKDKSVTLRNLIANDPVLAPFQRVPSKDNGVDIEGLAIDAEGTLYAGFRAPVLRGGYTPVLVLRLVGDPDDDEPPKFKEKNLSAELRLVQLGGLGIRSLASVSDGFLVLAGPVASIPASFVLFHWDGSETVPGADDRDAHSRARALCRIPVDDPDVKPEGLAVLEETGTAFRFLVVHDGIEGGLPTIFGCERPAAP